MYVRAVNMVRDYEQVRGSFSVAALKAANTTKPTPLAKERLMSNKEAIKILQKAKELIKAGWSNGLSAPDKVEVDNRIFYTPYGAVREAGKNSKWWTTAYSFLSLTIRDIPFQFPGLYEWNTAPGQTMEGILEGFDACIARVQRNIDKQLQA